ncbi:hypothetical protein [Corynebacterium frankenforstense]
MARHKDTGALADLLGGLAADVDGLIGAVVVELSGSTRLAGGGEAEPAADAVAALARATTSVALSAGAGERAGTEPGAAEVPGQAVDALVRAGDRLVLVVPAGREVALGVVVEAAAVDPAVLRWVVTRHLEQTPLAEAAAAELVAAPEPKAVEQAPAEPTVEANATSHDATPSSTPAADGDGARLVEPEPLPGRGGGFDFESWLADYRAGGEKED